MPAGGPYSPRLDNLRGVLWMLAAVTLLTCMFVVIKQLVTELPVFVVALARTSISLACLLPWLARAGAAGVRTTRLGMHFLRGFFGIAAFVLVVYALQWLILADAMVLAFTSPFWSILISALVLGEAIRGNRVLAAVVGFCGVVMVVKPQGGIEPAMALALGSAVMTSGAMVSMKRLSSSEPPTRIVFYFMLFGTLLLVPPAAATWQTPTAGQLGWLALTGVLGVVGQAFLARAYDAGEVGIIAPLDFVRLPVAVLLGFVVFGELPDAWSVAGTTVIILAAVHLARAGARRRR